MTPEPLPEKFAESARWLVQALDPRARLCRLVEMDVAAYRAASFLDDRMLSAKPVARLVRLEQVLAVGDSLEADRTGWIFHIGHVGSTLISRLLGELPGVLSIREPRSLRDLAIANDAERATMAAAVRRLMGRALAPGDQVIVKATSFVSEWAPLLVAPEARALFLYASPHNYIASILAGPNSTMELQALVESRRRRLARRGIEHGELRTDAQRAAAAWLTEMLSLDAAAMQMGARALWFDFDRMLEDMTDSLSVTAAHFGLDVSPGEIRETATGPLMNRYSKAVEFDYSPRLRRDLIAEANQQYGADIEQALHWLHGVVAGQSVAAPLANRLA